MTRKAFTLIELLVVISIIALLISILLPALKQARESAKAAECLSNQRSLAQAVLNYSIDHDGLMPIAYDGTSFGGGVAGWLPNRLTNSDYLPRVYDFQARGLFICPTTRQGDWETLGRFTIGYNGLYVYGRWYTPGSTFDTYKRLDSIVKSPSETAMFMDAVTDNGSSYQNFLMYSDPVLISIYGVPSFVHGNDSMNVVYNDSHAAPMPKVTYDRDYLVDSSPGGLKFWQGK